MKRRKSKSLARVFKFKLYPTKKQITLLNQQLRQACDLYNCALFQRKDTYSRFKKLVSYRTQAKEFTECRAEGLTSLSSATCGQNVLIRLQNAYDAMFDRIKANKLILDPTQKKPIGVPRYRPHRRYNSLTFPMYGASAKIHDNGKLYVQGIGEIKIKMHREIKGVIKTVTVVRSCGQWFVSFGCDVEKEPLPESTLQVGIDVGLESFAILSNNEFIKNPRYFKNSEAKLRRANRKVARRVKYSKRRAKAIVELQKVSRKVANQRRDFHHKVSYTLILIYGLICIEDLNIEGLARSFLAKSVHDVGWSNFFRMLTYKAESAGRELIKVDPRGTSQRCHVCGTVVKKELSVRWHECPSCGLSIHRDLNSAKEILRLGLSLKDITWSDSSCVSLEAA